MPKPSRQARTDREVTEDSIASTPASTPQATSADCDANASALTKAGSLANFPEISSDTLLKMISTAVAEEGQRTQKSVKESFDKFESILDAKLNNIIRRIDDVVATTDSLKTRQTESEARISGLEDDIAPMKRKMEELEKTNKELISKVVDLEGRSRRDNIKLLNLAEATEGGNPIEFFEGFIPKLLKLPVTSVAIDRAHRGFGAPGDGSSRRPRPVYIKLQRSRDVRMILLEAKRHGKIQYEDTYLQIVPDIPQSVRIARRAFNTVCAHLIERNTRFQMAYPAVCPSQLTELKIHLKLERG
ncbi:hypothetical protein WMY93_020682 [Mugilogobius chulae]|uniref:Transposase n=1 Tax=Mugilogobius chulae TaxID=88201 RepID=A0AAW0N8H4_9GOBI